MKTKELPALRIQDAAGRGEHTRPEQARIDPRRIYRVISIGLAWTDLLCLATALLIAYFVRFGNVPLTLDYILVMLAAAPIWLLTFNSYELYAPWRMSAPEEFRRVLSATSVGVVFFVLVSFWSHSEFSRAWVGLTWTFALLLHLTFRRMWSARRARLRASGELLLRTMIIGSPRDAEKLVSSLTLSETGFAPIGFLDTAQGAADASVRRLGTVDQVEPALKNHAVDCVFVAGNSLPEEGMLKVARAARVHGAEIWSTANLPEMLTSRLGIQPIAGTMAFSLRQAQLTGPQSAMKRAFDIVVAGVLMLFASPLLAAIALSIKLTSPGPVLFKQERVTSGSRKFRMYKFRTMRTDAAQELDREGHDRNAAFFKVGEDDPRITKVGRILRSLSLDELPQLWNVMKGEMSLVGPRPLPVEQVGSNRELLEPRHEVRAGMTGWWQIRGRSDVEPEEAVRLDIFYIENWSLALDLYVLAKTAGAVLSKRGAR